MNQLHDEYSEDIIKHIEDIEVSAVLIGVSRFWHADKH